MKAGTEDVKAGTVGKAGVRRRAGRRAARRAARRARRGASRAPADGRERDAAKERAALRDEQTSHEPQLEGGGRDVQYDY